MVGSVDELRHRYFGNDVHPYRLLEREIEKRLPSQGTLLDAGCGRTAPVLAKFKGRAGRLIGVDLVNFEGADPELELHNGDITRMPLEDSSVDLAYSRSVMEHVENPPAAFAELNRVLKPGGYYIFLTPSFYDYASLIAAAVPNRWHPRIVRFAEGRAEADVFPTFYRTNTRRAIVKHAETAGFDIRHFEYLGQYPAYFAFNALLFRVASFYEMALRRYETLAPLRGWIMASLQKRPNA